MAANDFVYAVHNDTKVISSIPRAYLALYDFYTELSDSDIAEVRKEEAARLYGTPSAQPSTSWRKDDLTTYAETHGIELDPTATKAEILGAISAQEGVK